VSTAERGSVLALVPAAILIVVVLAAITVDTAVALLGEREAAALAEGAANDAVAAALDEHAYRSTGEYRIDEARARRAVATTMASTSSELEAISVAVDFPVVGGEPAVRVTVTGTIDSVFASGLPGGPDHFEVEASATAVAREG
jgi:hypothetical protein